MTVKFQEPESARYDDDNNSRQSNSFGRLFRRTPKGRGKPEKREATTPPPEEEENPVSREQAPLVTRTMYVEIPKGKEGKEKKFPVKKEIVLAQPPSARESAFDGPPRYDWIDIETSAAVKVQAAFRRNKVMNDLERQGKSTGAIRNRSNRRKATNSMLSVFPCCGATLQFYNFDDDDYEAHREYQRMVYKEQKKVKKQQEEDLRSGFLRILRARRAKKNLIDEAIEVVE